jgi:hypothetical protein
MSPQVRRASQRAIALTVGAVAPIPAALGLDRSRLQRSPESAGSAGTIARMSAKSSVDLANSRSRATCAAFLPNRSEKVAELGNEESCRRSSLKCASVGNRLSRRVSNASCRSKPSSSSSCALMEFGSKPASLTASLQLTQYRPRHACSGMPVSAANRWRPGGRPPFAASSWILARMSSFSIAATPG